MDWDFRDQLQSVDLAGGGKAHYVYDAQGRRIRKVIERNSGALIEETIYLGGFEIFRHRNGAGTITLERETLHVVDDRHSMALVETRTIGNDGSPAQLIRYQFSNHLGSASLELDASCQLISYEEYYPYGSTSYQAVRSQTETPRRYRFTGMERDDESGLNCHGARYYATWLGRWTSCDPSGIEAGTNLFLYANNSPVQLLDTSGNDSERCSFPVNDEYKYKIGTTHCLPVPLKKRKPKNRSSGNRGKQQGQGQGKGKGDGSTGGKPGGKVGGLDGGTATKTPTGSITEQGAGDGPGGVCASLAGFDL
jgi:RHS repeat-associated protein